MTARAGFSPTLDGRDLVLPSGFPHCFIFSGFRYDEARKMKEPSGVRHARGVGLCLIAAGQRTFSARFLRRGAGSVRTEPAHAFEGARTLGDTPRQDLRPGTGVHSPVYVGRTGAAGNLGPQTRRPRDNPWRISTDRNERAGDHDLRALSQPARQAHRLAIVRSVHHGDVNHTTATHELLTGRPIPVVGGGLRTDDWPHYGAVLAHLGRGDARTSLPPFIQLRPTVRDGAPRFVEQSHGQGAGWLGPAANPFTIDDDPNLPNYRIGAFRLPENVAPGRLDDRRQLLRRSMPKLASWSGNRQSQTLDSTTLAPTTY